LVALRPGAASDLPALVAIYNHYVETTPITFDVEPFSVETRRPWLAQFAPRGRYRLIVAEHEGKPIGYACSMRFRAKEAYDPSIETSIYLAPSWTGRGLGRKLYAELFTVLAGEDVHRAYAGITLPNAVSVSLHEKVGFERVGVMREVGFKLGRYWDVAWYEKALP
jgi:phosphinothricin acetyltransferase